MSLDSILVVPFHDEAERWSDAYWDAMLRTNEIGWILVDDGSTDGTTELLAGFTAPHVIVHRIERNVGKSNAVRQGMLLGLDRFPSGRRVGFLDGDAAFAVDEVHDVVRQAGRLLDDGGFDAVWSSRVALAGRHIERRLSRHYAGRIVATYLFRGVAWAPYDSQCGFKIFEVSEGLVSSLQDPFETRWFVDIELLARLATEQRAIPRVREIPLETWRDVAGSKVASTALMSILRELRVARRHVRTIEREAA